MKLVRIAYQGAPRWGSLEGERIHLLEGDPYESPVLSGQVVPAKEAKWLPCAAPEKIIGIGLNYRDHIEAGGLQVPTEPYIVHRPRNTLNGNNAKIPAGNPQHSVQFEGELCVVIGRAGKNISPAGAGAYILGYTCADDITDKFYFRRDKHFGVAKAFDGQCPVGPWIETDYDWRNKRVTTRQNGQTKQDGNTASMVFGCEELVAALSAVMSLAPGDIILTGSPAGSADIKAGDEIEVEVEGLGVLRHTIIE